MKTYMGMLLIQAVPMTKHDIHVYTLNPSKYKQQQAATSFIHMICSHAHKGNIRRW